MPLFNPELSLQDHGVDQGPIDVINLTGSVSISVADEVATITISGGSANISQVEVDFGSIPTRSKTFIITDATITNTSHIVPVQAGDAATGRSADENEMDPILFSAIPGSGQFTLIGSALNGPVVGKFKINYMVQ